MKLPQVMGNTALVLVKLSFWFMLSFGFLQAPGKMQAPGKIAILVGIFVNILTQEIIITF